MMISIRLKIYQSFFCFVLFNNNKRFQVVSLHREIAFAAQHSNTTNHLATLMAI